MTSGSAWVDGKLSDLRSASIPLTDRGLLFGHAIFETILAIQGSLVLWEAHFQRLRSGAQLARLGCPSEICLREAIAECLEHFKTHQSEADWKRLSVRLILTGGDGLGLRPHRDDSHALLPARIIVICRAAEPQNSKVRELGYSLKLCPDGRSKELIEIKSCNYLWNLMCLDDSLIEGFDDALFVNADGEISESTIASFVWMPFGKKELCSAPQEKNVLPGTTLLCLQSALAALDYNISWKALRIGDLINVRACALISSVRGIVPIRQINDFVLDVQSQADVFDEWNKALFAEQVKHREFRQT